MAESTVRPANAQEGLSEHVNPPDHVFSNQEEIFCFLGSSATYSGVPTVKRIDTHGAVVFLAGPDAYKVKRAVRFAFMDLSTLEKRKRACESEVIVNRNNAPGVYLGAIPIVRQGTLRLGGEGEIVEWVVHMRRFDEELTLDRVAERGELTADLVDAIAAAVAASHARALRRETIDFVPALRDLIKENDESLDETPEIFDRPRVHALTTLSLQHLEGLAELLHRRAAAGEVRRCHGDLHLRNLVLLQGQPTLFDAIEFDEALATIDTLYDLAFLVMDLWSRRLRREANRVVNRYLAERRDDATLAGMALLPLFVSVRAAIRAKVTVANLGHLGGAARAAALAEARHYFALAESSLSFAKPILIALGGLSGTGKTSLAAELAPEIGRLPGAVHLRSDVERKRLLGTPELQRLPSSAYDQTTTRAVYDVLAHKAETVLRAGQAVVLDAVHARREERDALEELARCLAVPFVGLWLEAPLSVLVPRVTARISDASDADATVVERQAQLPLGALRWHRLDASGDRGAVVERARDLLAASLYLNQES
jgi:aminoglycoside phosphotransferase family enzyme/predicted kinase